MTLPMASHRPCVAYTNRLFNSLHFEFIRHRNTDYESHKREAVHYALDKLRSIKPMNGGQSPVHIAADGRITLKCGTPECMSYVPGEHLTRVKVMVQIPDNEVKPGPVTNNGELPMKTIQVERELCPHCFVLSSKSGTQLYSPTPEAFGRSASKNQPGMIWRNLRLDARSAAEIDPEAYQRHARRYGR